MFRTSPTPPSCSTFRLNPGPAFLAELVACTVGLCVLEHLKLTGSVRKDCQGLVRTQQKHSPLKRDSGKAGYHLLRACLRATRVPNISLYGHRSHPERSATPRSGWTPHRMGLLHTGGYAPGAPARPIRVDLQVVTGERRGARSSGQVGEGEDGGEGWGWE